MMLFGVFPKKNQFTVIIYLVQNKPTLISPVHLALISEMLSNILLLTTVVVFCGGLETITFSITSLTQVKQNTGIELMFSW